MTAIRRIAIIGFGEVGSTLAADLSRQEGVRIAAWDVQFAQAGSAASGNLRGQPGVVGADSAVTAVQDAEFVFSAVTAAEDLAAAMAAAPGLGADTWFIDLNSVAPGTRREVARVVEARGARYVEAAVMAPIAPRRIATAVLLGGRHAEKLAAAARALGFTGMRAYSDDLGPASAAKMCRSVIVKGFEALAAESLLSARYYGVEAEVIGSLSDLFPGADWHALSRYMISRSLEHGRRRAEEMREVAATVRESGVEPWMSVAAAERQAWAAGFATALAEPGLAGMLDAIRAGMNAVTEE